MAWTFTIDYQDGGGARDITGLVEASSISRKRRLHNNLAPTVNTLTFRMKWDSTHMNLLMTTLADIIVAVNDNSGNAYFRGLVKPNFSVNTSVRPDYIQVECVDNSWLLQKKIMSNLTWAGYTVSNPSTTATSIVHQLMVSAGYSLSDVSSSIPTVAKTIANYIVIKGEKTYWQALQEVTFEFGYAFYFGDDGKLNLYDFAPGTVTAAGSFTNANMIGTLGLKRSQREYDGARVKWYGLKTFSDVVVASDTSGGNGVYKALIAVLASDSYPEGAETYSTYIDYKYQDYEVVAVTSAALDIVKDAAMSTVVFTDEIKRARVRIDNTDGASTKYIYKMDVVGNAICKDTYNWTEAPSPLTSDKILEIDTQWISAAADAQKLSDAISQYYRNVEFTYNVRSREVYNPGQFVDVEETSWLNIDNRCSVVEVVDNDFWQAERYYTLEGVAAYSAGTTSTSQTVEPVVVPKRTDGYTVAASGSTMDCDARCDGTADQTEINAAITLVNGQGGGTVYLVGGQFNLSAAVEMKSNVTLWIDSGVTLEKNCDDRAIEAVGTSGTHLTNIYLAGGGTITRNSSDTYAKPLVYLEYVDDSYIDNVLVDDSYDDGIYILNCDTVKLGAGVKIANCDGVGLKTIASVVVIASAIAISGCGNGYECWPSLATDKISNGNCESTDEPMLDNETTPVVSGVTWERSSAQKYSGSYSYRITKSGAPSGFATLQDSGSDMHGITAGSTLLLDFKLRIPSSGMLYTELIVYCRAYVGASYSTYIAKLLPIYDEWQSVRLIVPTTVATTEIAFTIQVEATASATEYADFDDIHVYEFTDTDSGCQLVNSSVSDCTDTGVLVANSHAIIQNNQITGNTNAGLVIAAGYRNLVTNNRCYNNGSDTGLGNENSDNFYDAGIDTQLSGNSWQQPVTEEPSHGTPHKHVATIISTDPASTAVQTLDISAHVPVGTTWIEGYWFILSATANRTIRLCNADDTEIYIYLNNPVAGQYGRGHFSCPVVDRKIYWAVNNTDVSSIGMQMNRYWC